MKKDRPSSDDDDDDDVIASNSTSSFVSSEDRRLVPQQQTITTTNKKEKKNSWIDDDSTALVEGNRRNMSEWIERQEYVNRSYDRLAKFNFALTYANMVKTSQIDQKCGRLTEDVRTLENDVRDVRGSVASHAGKVTELEDEFSTIRDRVARQRGKIEDLHRVSDLRRKEVEAVLDHLSEKVKSQQRALDVQERLVSKLGDSKLKQDALVDVCAVVVAVVFSGSFVVDWPIQIVSAAARTLITSRRGRTRLSQLGTMMRFVAFVLCVSWIRRLAARSGIHSFVGGPYAYARIILDAAKAKLFGETRASEHMTREGA